MKYWKITRSFKYQNKKKLIDSAHYNGLEKWHYWLDFTRINYMIVEIYKEWWGIMGWVV